MNKRDYYAARKGRITGEGKLDFDLLKRLFKNLYLNYEQEGYFQKQFGYYCVDAGEVPGAFGADIEAGVYLLARKPGLWPIQTKADEYGEDDLFTMVEFLYDHVAKPIEGYQHTFNNCGIHYSTFSVAAGQEKFRLDINHLLKDYETGYELSLDGEILALVEPGFAPLLEAMLPTEDKVNIKERVELAKLKFRRQKSSWDERSDAIRDLADVLEFIRPDVKKHISKTDEADLFNLANNFGIRHHNLTQKKDYDKRIWYPWMFYYYLSTIHALLRFMEKAKQIT